MHLLLVGLLIIQFFSLPLEAALLRDCTREDFEIYKKSFGKVYATYEEHEFRFNNFCKNLQIIEAHNSIQPNAKFGVNKFTDMSPEEFSQKYKMPKSLGKAYARVCMDLGSKASDIDVSKIPSSFDWRDHDAVTPVKNQGPCGSCWAFSTTGIIESAYAIKYGKQVLLSEQMLVDCGHGCCKIDDEPICNQGCNGGFPWNAYEDILKWGGLLTESEYPYRAIDQACKVNLTNSPKLVAPIRNYTCLSGPDSANEKEMAAWLAAKGPISIGINADYLQSYISGIIEPVGPWDCPKAGLDHAVLIVGYGEENGKPYWIIKNSWGTDWGEKGYFRIIRGKEACGVNAAASSVVL